MDFLFSLIMLVGESIFCFFMNEKLSSLLKKRTGKKLFSSEKVSSKEIAPSPFMATMPSSSLTLHENGAKLWHEDKADAMRISSYIREIERGKRAVQPYKKKIMECAEIIENDIKKSQTNAFTNTLMIPLCVSYADKDHAKKLGSFWDPKTKSWFWSFHKDRQLVKQWLPKIYQSSHQLPYILPRLISEPLWFVDLRLGLSQEQWEKLKKLTYEQSGYRCCVCGCRGDKWSVECDEMWVYDINRAQSSGTVYFQGLQSLCLPCHQVHHLGKAKIDGHTEMALARLMVLNDWPLEKALETSEQALISLKKTH